MSGDQGTASRHDFVLAIHGGVGTLPEEAMSAERAAEYRGALLAALEAGFESLAQDGTAIDAVVAAVSVMEDAPLFNAGRGSNFDERGVVTMDASIMDGATLEAGAVAGVTDVRHPARLARMVMERSDHVMLIGDGAERFARLHGIGTTDPDYFHTDRRWDALQRAKETGARRPNVLGDETDASSSTAGPPGAHDPESHSGTVGAVARDRRGHLGAATSTGGMANKAWGRVGDSPIIGAGTYASRLCAVSCTGWGEYFIRNAAAYDVHARMAHGGASLSQAVEGVVFDTLERQIPRSGGMIAVDAGGQVELVFNTPGMYRGRVGSEGRFDVRIYD